MLSALLVLVLAACAASGPATTTPDAGAGAPADAGDSGAAASDLEPVRIGAIYALTGDVAAIGQNIRRGIEFAVDEVNSLGGVNGRPIEIIWGDSEGDPRIGMAAAERLITQDNVVALIGAHQSAVTEVVSQVAERHGVPMITAISTADALTTRGYQYFFRMAPTNSIFLRSMVQYLVDLDRYTDANINTVSIIAENTLLGQETSLWGRFWAEYYGFEVLADVLYPRATPDLTSEVLTIRQANADALLVDSYISDGILLTRTMVEQGFTPGVFVGKATAFIDPTFIPNTGPISNGISTAVEWNPDTDRGQDINAAFYERFGVNMNGHTAQVYTAIWVLRTAMEEAEAIERSAIRDALANIRIEGQFPNGGPALILPYDVLTFEDVEWRGVQHTNTNANAVVTVAQVQDGVLRTVWPFEYTDLAPIYPAPFS